MLNGLSYSVFTELLIFTPESTPLIMKEEYSPASSASPEEMSAANDEYSLNA